MFNPSFWITLTALGAVLSLAFYMTANTLAQDEHDRKSLLDHSSSVILALGGLSIPAVSDGVSTRMVFLSFCFFGAVVNWSFTAVLISHLAVDNFELPIKGLADLLHNSGYQLVVVKDSSYEDFFTQANENGRELKYFSDNGCNLDLISASNSLPWQVYKETMEGNQAAFYPGHNFEALLKPGSKSVLFTEKLSGKREFDPKNNFISSKS